MSYFPSGPVIFRGLVILNGAKCSEVSLDMPAGDISAVLEILRLRSDVLLRACPKMTQTMFGSTAILLHIFIYKQQ